MCFDVLYNMQSVAKGLIFCIISKDPDIVCQKVQKVKLKMILYTSTFLVKLYWFKCTVSLCSQNALHNTSVSLLYMVGRSADICFRPNVPTLIV